MTDWDIELAHFLLAGGTKISEPDAIVDIYGSIDKDAVMSKQREDFKNLPKLMWLYEHVELNVLNIVAQMKIAGIQIDKDLLTKIHTEFVDKRESLVRQIKAHLGDININSPKQLGERLVAKYKLLLPKTKTGQYKTTSDELHSHVSQYPFICDILEFRILDKIINGYIEPIMSRLDENSRIHPQYDLMSAATGRLASSEPNIQSTPVVGIYGGEIRKVFVAPTDCKLVSFDYSQQELRILAHLSQDRKLCDAFAKNIDVHSQTAQSVLSLPEDKINADERRVGKILNFGIMYGETSFGLSRQLHKSPQECSEILKKYFENYEGVKKYFDNLLTNAKIHGFVETILGRRRGIPGLPIYQTKKFFLPAEERILKNFPIQGSAADMTKKAMVDVWQNVLPKYPQAKLIMQIHDELVFEYSLENKTSEGDLENFIDAVRKCMSQSVKLSVPVIVDAKVGSNWADI
jgi:DNA polymerase I